jgi:hypothetical protein
MNNLIEKHNTEAIIRRLTSYYVFEIDVYLDLNNRKESYKLLSNAESFPLSIKEKNKSQHAFYTNKKFCSIINDYTVSYAIEEYRVNRWRKHLIIFGRHPLEVLDQCQVKIIARYLLIKDYKNAKKEYIIDYPSRIHVYEFCN